MKKILVIFILVFSFCFTKAQVPNFQWVQNTFGINQSVIDIVSDATGNFYVTGYFFSMTDFNPGPGSNFLTPLNGDDIYVVKLNSLGNFLWARQIDNGMVEQPLEIYVGTAGNVIVTGLYRQTFSSNYTIFVTKFNGSGIILWDNLLTGPSTSMYGAGVGYSTFIDNSGNVYINGDFNDTMDVDPGSGTFLVYGNQANFTPLIEKFNSTGSFMWAGTISKLSANAGGRGFSVVTDNSTGNVYTTGNYNGTLDFDPGLSTYSLTATNTEAYILNLNSSGNFIWAKQLSGFPSASSGGSAVRLDNASNLYCYGWFSGTIDFDSGPGTYTLSSPTPTTNSYFSTKLDPLGNFLWAVAVSGMTVYSTDNDGLGNSYLAGNFIGTQDFDPGLGTFTLTSYGAEDGFLIKLDANGNFVWAGQIGDINPNSIARIGVGGASDIYCWGTAGTGICDMDPGLGIYSWSPSATNEYFLKIGQTSTGLNNLIRTSEINVYPNPTNGQFNLHFDKMHENLNVKIMNSLAQVVLQKTVLNTDRLSLCISDQSAGIYFVEVNTGTNTYRTKVVKE